MALTQVSTSGIKDATVATADIANNAITRAKITDGEVINAKLDSNAVTTSKINNNAVTTAKLAVGAVTHDQLADNTVDADHLQSNAVTTAKIADDAVTGAKIADDSITSAHLASNSVNTAELIDGAVNSAKIANNVIVNADINASAAIAGSKIDPNFGSQNVFTSGTLECNGEFKPRWFGHQSQCTDNTHNTHYYHKVAEITGGGSQGGQIVFFGTNSYSSNTTNNTAARTVLVVRHTTDNKLDGIWWSESGANNACTDIRWKYTGSNNIYEIWIRKGAYNNVVPHITGSFDYAQTFGSSTGSGTAPSGSTAFGQKYQVQVGSSNVFTVNQGDVIFQNKRMFSASGYSNMNVAYSHDMPCADDSGNGQFFWVVAGHTHYNNSYGTTRVSAVHCRATTVVYANNVINETSSLGGSWSFYKPNNTTFRVTHNAGSYAYPGRYTITVYSST